MVLEKAEYDQEYLLNCLSMKSAEVNADVKMIVKKKDKKFQGSDAPHSSSDPMKAQGLRITPRRESFNQRYKPAWQTWGQRKADPSRDIGLIHTQDVFGNHKKGMEWVEEQKKRQEENIYDPGKAPVNHDDISADDQIIYIEPSVSQARLKRLRQLGRAFTDEDFPPNDYSLSGPYGPLPDWEPIKWRRTSFAIPNGGELFTGKIEPNDIQQGFLGDCYFLAGLAAICQRPDRIMNLFLLKEKNEMNYFSVKMLYRGKWREIDIDDYVPFIFNAPAFSKSRENELWVVVLEKAWAKIYGSYKQIEAGFPEEPLHDLTGAPIKHIFLNTKGEKYEEQWAYLVSASLNEYAMVASSKPGSDTDQSNSGIYQGHAYTFLNATLLEARGQKVKVVQIRNPWGKGEYKGRWSDGDSAWDSVSQQEKGRVGYKNYRQDGIFFMQYEDFVQEFRNITIAEINDNASYVYESYYDPECKGAYFTIKVCHPATYSFQVDKTPERSFTGNKQRSYQYPEAWLEIGRLEGTNVIKQQGYISRRRTLFKSYDLQPGKYVAWVQIKFDPTFEEDFEVNLAVYAEYACGIKLSTREEAGIFQSNPRIEWTGEKRKKPVQNQPQVPMPPKKQDNAQLFNFLNRDRNTNKEGFNENPNSNISDVTPQSNIGGNSNVINSNVNVNNSLGITSPSSTGMKKRKVRKIETHHVKTEVVEENEFGEGVVKTTEKEVRKETLITREGDGRQNVKSKEHERQIDSTENTIHGESLNKKEKLTETVKIRQTKANGETMEKVETQEHEIETLEVDDESTISNGTHVSRSSRGSNIKAEIAYHSQTHSRQPQRREPHQPLSAIKHQDDSYNRPHSNREANVAKSRETVNSLGENSQSHISERKINSIRNQMELKKKSNDELKYQEPDSESNESQIYRM